MCGGAGTSGGKCGKNRVVVSYICRDLSILLAENAKKKENRRIAEADGMKAQVFPQIETTKGEKSGYFWEKVPDVWKILLGQLRSALCLT